MDEKSLSGLAADDSRHISPDQTTLDTADLSGVVRFRPTASHGKSSMVASQESRKWPVHRHIRYVQIGAALGARRFLKPPF